MPDYCPFLLIYEILTQSNHRQADHMITINFRSIPTLIANHHFLYLQLEKVEFTFIGPEWGDDDGNENGNDHGDGGKDNNGAAGNSPGGDKKPKSAAQLEGEVMVGELVAATEGLMCTMEVILDKSNVYLSFCSINLCVGLALFQCPNSEIHATFQLTLCLI